MSEAKSGSLADSRFGLLALAGTTGAWLVAFASRWIGAMLHRGPAFAQAFRPLVVAVLLGAVACAVVGAWRDAKKGPALIALAILAFEAVVIVMARHMLR